MDIIVNGRFLTQPITGVQRYARELISAFDAILEAIPELRITILTPRLSGAVPTWRNIELRQVGYLRGNAWEQLELPWYASGKMLFCPGNTAPVISLLRAQPVIVTVHDLSFKYFPDAYQTAFRLWYGFLIPLVLRRARFVITVSESERNAISAYYPEVTRRLYAIQNGGLTADQMRCRAGKAERGNGYVLYVGSLSKRKNFTGVFEAASRLARKRGFYFIFIGGTAASLAVFSFEVPTDVLPYIKFTGQTDDTAMLVRRYQEATCLLFPSFYEASPLPPIEAMSCGCPVIASEIPSLRERCGDAAAYCNPYDVESIVATVERVMDDPALRATLQERGYKRAATFTWEHCAHQTLELLCRG
jgi:glycosyltransferase involved in cell wall biosynthesis